MLYAKPKTLIILDIDNTLVTPAQSLGNDAWFYLRVDELKQQGYSQQTAIDRAILELEAVHNLTKVVLPQESIPHVISSLQEKKIPLMALSTRSAGQNRATLYQLASVNIDMRKSLFAEKECCFLKKEIVAFRNGTLFCSGTHKGEALFHLLENLQFIPEEIVFINDKASNIREVEEMCEQRNIPCIGLRYGRLDEKMKSYNKKVAEVQLKRFQLLPDQEVEKEIFSDH